MCLTLTTTMVLYMDILTAKLIIESVFMCLYNLAMKILKTTSLDELWCF